jgi:hypothetical protein
MLKTCSNMLLVVVVVAVGGVAGAQWHPILLTKQNNLIKSELPNFVRNLYDNCRGPPRLFLLDK